MTAARSLRGLANDLTGRAMRERADLLRRLRRRGSAELALSAFGSRDRSDVSAWTDLTAARHDDYRRSVDPIAAPVAVICSSHRPADLANVERSVGQQRGVDVELVFVAHGDQWDVGAAERALSRLEGTLRRVQVLHRPTHVSLGGCLNAALVSTESRFVAKFDSDDRYGPLYLADALRAHRYAGAGVVGKHSYYVHSETSDTYWLRFPGHEFTYTGTMSGGTLVIDRDVVGDQHFADVSIGEDRKFLRDCHRRGISTFAGDRFNYTVVRSGQNTWMIPENQLLDGAVRLDAGQEANIDR